MTKKHILSALLAATMMISVTGCEFRYEEEVTKATDENETEDAVGKNTVRILYNNKQYKTYLEKCKAQFQRENEGVTIILEHTEASDYIEDINERSTEGDRVPDVYIVDSSKMGTVYLAGLASKINTTPDITEAFCETAMNACSYNGNLVGYPLGFRTTFLAYNSSYIDEAESFNIKEIMDYADSTEIIENENGQRVEKIFSCNLSDLFMNYGYVGAGIEIGGPYGSDVNDFSVSNKDTIEATGNYLALIEFFSIEPEKEYEDVVKDFVSGKNVFAIVSTDSLPEIEKVEGMKYAFAEFPDYNSTDKTAPLAVTSAVAVNPYSDNTVLADKFAKYVSMTMSDELYDASGILSANAKVTAENDKYKGIYDSYIKADNKNKYQYGEQVYPLIEIALHNIIKGEDAEDELQAVDAYMKKQLK